MKLSGIYSITNIESGKIYIGSSVNMHKRKISHFNTLRNNKHRNRHLQYSFNKYGESAFFFDVVEYCPAELLIECEQKWLDFINPDYNIMTRADRKVFTDEHKKRLSEAHIGNKHTQEAKDKIGAASKGNKYRVGKKISEEQKEAIRNAKIGKRGRRCVENPLYGRKRPKDVVDRMVKTRAKNKKEKPDCFCGAPYHAKGLCERHYKHNWNKNKK